MVSRAVFVIVASHALAGLTLADETSSSIGPGRAAVSLQAGFSSGTADMAGAAVGGTVVYDLGSRLAVEAAGSYLGYGMGTSGLSVSAAVLVHLRPRSEKAVPYLAAGGGLYRASFAMGDWRFDDQGATPGAISFPMMSGMAPGRSAHQMPMFYANRLGMGWQNRRSSSESFTDPAISLGGGIRIDLGSRLSLRPDLRALVITSSGDTRTLGVFTVNFGYRF